MPATVATTADIHKRDLIRILAKRMAMPQREVERVLDTFADELAFQLHQGCTVVWTSVGTFEMRDRAARRGVNPQTGEHVSIAATRVPGFTCAEVFKARVTGTPSKYRRRQDAVAAD